MRSFVSLPSEPPASKLPSTSYCGPRVGVAKGITVLHKVFGDASALRDIVKIAMSKWPYPDGKRTGASKRDLRG